MEKSRNENIGEGSGQEMTEGLNDQQADDTDFIKDFIERKKLQNRILKEIIENIKITDKK